MSFSTIDPQVVNALEGVAAIAFSALSAYAVKLARTHISAGTLANVDTIITRAVKAAEQMGIGKMTGTAKFQLAEKIAIADAARIGITLTPGEIQTGIEAAVTDLKAAGIAMTSSTVPAGPTPEQVHAAAAAALRAVADQMDAEPPVVSPVVPAA